jgi:hypothetical protein
MVRPIAFAAFRLITSWSFVNACTGRSAGIAPSIIRNWRALPSFLATAHRVLPLQLDASIPK